jgi:twinkle protein
METESKVVSRKRCPKCAAQGNDTSGNNLAVYDDGHSYCYACEFYVRGNKPMETIVEETPVYATEKFRSGEIQALPHRRINEKTARQYGYATTANGAEVENFYSADGTLQAQHIRYEGKKFAWIGDTSNLQFYGQNLFPSGGKRILITEGAIDCLTMAQLFDNKYPVVSIPNGVNSAVRCVKDNYDYLSSFETIVLCFDMDDPGQKAARDVAEILPPGKVKIMSLPRKDPNEMLVHAEAAQLLQAYWNAKTYSPDSILHVSQVVSENENSSVQVYEYPWDSLTTFMIGQDSGRLNLWTSATGHGKSTIIRELVVDHLNHGRAVGAVFLEESPEQTVDDLISLKIGKPVRKIMSQRQLNELRKSNNKSIVDMVEDNLTEEEYAEAKTYISSKPLYLYDHIGNSNINNIINRLEYMAVGLDCKVIFLDHITLLGNMLLSSGSDFGNDERLVLDSVMKKLRELVERTGVTLHVIAHIKKTDKNVDEGDRINLNDLRGSGSLAQIADNVFALERNAQHPDPLTCNTTNVRVLKNRKGGRRGIATALFYNDQTSKLMDVPFVITPEGEVLYRYDQVSV